MPTAREERLRHHWDEGAERYDERIAPLERRYLAASRAWVGERARGEVLEVAIGTGLNLPHYGRDTRLTAVELSEGMLAVARRRSTQLGLDLTSVETTCCSARSTTMRRTRGSPCTQSR